MSFNLELENALLNTNKRAVYLENNFYNLTEKYKNNIRKYTDNNLISKSFAPIENNNDNETEQTIKIPEVFFSPRKDDRYHDADADAENDNDNNQLVNQTGK